MNDFVRGKPDLYFGSDTTWCKPIKNQTQKRINWLIRRAVIRLGNSGWRVGFVSTRLTRLHNLVQHKTDPIINRVESLNPNTTQLPTELLKHDPGNPFTSFDSLNSEEEELKKLHPNRLKKKKDRLRLRLKKTNVMPIASKPWPWTGELKPIGKSKHVLHRIQAHRIDSVRRWTGRGHWLNSEEGMKWKCEGRFIEEVWKKD